MNRFANFGVSFLIVILIPLIPIGLEWWLAGQITDRSLTITAAIYSVSTGTSSRYGFFLILTVVISIIFAACFGYILAIQTPPSHCREASFATIFCMSFIHGLERFRVHVLLRQPFQPLFKS